MCFRRLVGGGANRPVTANGAKWWLHDTTGHKAQVVSGEMQLRPGMVYVAPDDGDLVFSSLDTLDRVVDGTKTTITPCIDSLFLSAVRRREQMAAMLLTGMGKDAVNGLDKLHRAGVLTVAQHPGTCAVSSMPQTAIDCGAADLVMKPEQLAQWCKTVVSKG